MNPTTTRGHKAVFRATTGDTPQRQIPSTPAHKMFTPSRKPRPKKPIRKGTLMPTIVVWSKPSCVQCTATYRKLDNLGFTYEVRDLTADPEAVEAFKARGLMSAPIVTVDDEAWAGFNPIKLGELAAKYQLVSA